MSPYSNRVSLTLKKTCFVALPDTPARSLDLDFSGAGIVGSSQVDAGVEKLDPLDDKEPYHETEMVRPKIFDVDMWLSSSQLLIFFCPFS